MTEWIVIDTETTGLNPAKDKVVEIAAVWSEGSYSSIIDPHMMIPPEASAIHHLTNNDVIGLPDLNEVVSNIPASDYMVAHNVAFDQPFLPMFKDRKWICTMRLAQHIWPDAPNWKNQTLRYYLYLKVEIPEGLHPHRALYDTLVTTALFQEMLKKHPIEELYSLQSKPILKKLVGFGKHRGTPWSAVPRDYLQWAAKTDMDSDTLYTIQHYLTL